MAKACMFAVAPVGFPKIVLAVAWASMPTVTLLAPIAVVMAVEPEPDTSPDKVMVWFAVRQLAHAKVPPVPPTNEPRVPEYVRGEITVGVDVGVAYKTFPAVEFTVPAPNFNKDCRPKEEVATAVILSGLVPPISR